MRLNFTNESANAGIGVKLAPVVNIAAYSTVYGVISLIALVGNVLVCYVIVRNPDMRTVTNAFLLNLAVADVLFTVISVPPLLGIEISPDYWVFGEGMCKTVPFLNTVTLSASIYTMVALAFDRYHAIVNPFRAKIYHTIKRTLLVITLIWLFSIAVASPQIPTQNIIHNPPYRYCREDWTEYGGDSVRKAYSAAVFAIFFAIPVAIITWAYSAIMRKMRTTAEFSEGMRAGSVNHARVGRTKRKTTMMMLMVIVVFLVCMLPFNILVLVATFLPLDYLRKNFNSITLTLTILKVPVVVASACNPIIYNFFSVKFKLAFADVFSCGKRGAEDTFKRPGKSVENTDQNKFNTRL